MSAQRLIPIADIDAGNRLRALDPAWVKLLAEEIETDGHREPIRVVERGSGFKLVSGALRMAAISLLGRTEIKAHVEPAEAYAAEASVRLAEIKADLLRRELTVLDRARYIAAWREVYETVHTPKKRGRKSAAEAKAGADELIANFANNFTDAAKAALGLSQRSIYLALQIASISPDAADRIALHPVANKQNELLILADQNETKQAAIVAMLTSDPAKASTVTEALVLLGERAEPQKLAAYERTYEKMATWKPADRERLFDLLIDEIEVYMARRNGTGTAKAA
ncbi:ParB N-terminal domain-containing protein [Aureimonas sp. SK2]|uniref:ParB N-terminal domain-containing protein n=1 Tax=Aureimonas sp. SK2 TaxID=3015992 RepID=UPI002444BB13|nr:ParB N-terminal domain-containing protein [Aureimonas sp. SK2]